MDAHQQRSKICLSKTSFKTNAGTLRVFLQMEMLLSSDPSATIVDALDASLTSPSGNNKSGLKAATCIVFSCPTNEISLFHACRSITAPTKMGPFMALEAAMNDPSGDQLNRRKKVLPGERLKGFDTVSAHVQSSVFQILTVLSSLCARFFLWVDQDDV